MLFKDDGKKERALYYVWFWEKNNIVEADDKYRQTWVYRLFAQGRKLLLKNFPILRTQASLITDKLLDKY